ncbi:MAG: hypothetical protein SGCHY_001840 [Lobulomycetales sp.]
MVEAENANIIKNVNTAVKTKGYVPRDCLAVVQNKATVYKEGPSISEIKKQMGRNPFGKPLSATPVNPVNAKSPILKDVLASFALAQCNGPLRVRKEWRELDATEKSDFFNAVNALKTSNGYEKYTTMHRNFFGAAHNKAVFLPWHRKMLADFEADLTRVAGKQIHLPYWDWTVNSQNPEQSEVLHSNAFGTGGTGPNLCITDGAFANWRNEDGSCLRRGYGRTGKVAAFYSEEVVNNAVQTSSNFDTIWRSLEGALHGSVHVYIGGDLATAASTRDPLFFLHHAHIDKLFWEWQELETERKNEYARGASINDVLEPFGIKVADALSADTLCYRYSNGQVPVPPTTVIATTSTTSSTVSTSTTASSTTSTTSSTVPTSTSASATTSTTSSTVPTSTTTTTSTSTASPTTTTGSPVCDPYDRNDKLCIRTPPPIPDEWCKINGLNIAYVRAVEAENAKVIKNVNTAVKTKGYIPRDCLAVVQNNSTVYKEGPSISDIKKKKGHNEFGKPISETPANPANPDSPIYNDFIGSFAFRTIVSASALVLIFAFTF